jgi:hypothetical protein
MGAGLITFFISKGEQVNFLKDEQVPQAKVDEVQRLRLIMQGRARMHGTCAPWPVGLSVDCYSASDADDTECGDRNWLGKFMSAEKN